ncbi:MAG: BPSS1780 family membrane protein [Burkholderiales bacterium]|jgi:hypothetical protein
MQVVRITPGAGGRWMAHGFRLLRREPLALFGTAALFMLALALTGQVPLLGPIAIPVLIPLLTVGFVHVARTIDEGGKAHPLMLFEGFRPRSRGRLKPLLVLGVVNAVLTAVAMGLALVADGGALFRAMTGTMDPGDPSLRDGAIGYAMIVFVVLSVPIQMLMWYSPLFVAWNGRRPLEAVFFSLVACWRNKAAFAVYAGSWALVLLATTMGVLLLRQLLPGDAIGMLLIPGSPFSPITLLLIAALYASIWPSYREVVRDGQEAQAGDPPAMPG